MLNAMIEAARYLGSARDKTNIREGLAILVGEAQKPLASRNKKLIRITWSGVYDNLVFYRIINDFRDEPMKMRLMKFLKCESDVEDAGL